MSHAIALVELDIAKVVFQVHAAAEDGTPLLRKKLKRAEVEPFFKELPPCSIGLEACPGGHHLARLLRSMGHDVRLLPAQYVRPYVKTNKNDAADAEAICEAMTRPSMRFVPIKEEHQQEILVLHRVREMLMRQRTQVINGIRVHLAEFGIIAPARAHRIGLLIDVIRDEDDTRLPPAARSALNYLVAQFEEIATKLSSIDTELVALARQDDTCRRLMTIPGVGVIIATAMVASTRDPSDYKSGRHVSAWLGLVPRQNSTGGVDRLGGISKRGNGYLRCLLIHGIRSIMRWKSKSWIWLAKLRGRRPANVATVAVANKTARIIWAIMKYGGVYGEPANARA